MQSHTKSFVLVIVTVLISIAFASQSIFAARPGQTAPMAFPYVAQITGDSVNVRSGPGTNYYACGKLNKTDRVTVVASQFSWSRIVPPVGSFSWISKQYVTVDPAVTSIGIVTGDNVRVYAGSNDLKPIHSTTLQLKLNKDDEVKLLGQEQNGYYKIAPPTGAYLWVSTNYTRPLGSVDQVPVIVKTAAPVQPKPQSKAAPARPAQTRPAPAAAKPAAAPADAAVEAKKLKEFKALQERLDAERNKPMDEQNYADIKKAFAEIANNKKAGKAARYAAFGIKQAERCELALAAEKMLPLQDAQLQQLYQRIEKARDKKLAQIPQLYRFAAVGRFQLSSIYAPQERSKRYRVIDDSGKTACYAVPTGPALVMDLNRFIGKKVGLVGSIEPNPEVASALVRFTEIAEIK